MSIKNNIISLQSELKGGACKLIAVSKTQPIEKIAEAYQAGQKLFGENKAQEMASKYEQLPKDIEWHMIGHLQTNKVKYLAPFVALIHSVDSFKLLAEINKQAAKCSRVISCLLQIHIAREDTKFGFDEHELLSLLSSHELDALKNIRVVGLMGMATFTKNESLIRSEFQNLHQLYIRIKEMKLGTNVIMQELSMGMSLDYKIAVEEGSTMVRIGTAIFGERNYTQ
jgi:PLP dependent protein